jgi:hypothetical protein
MFLIFASTVSRIAAWATTPGSWQHFKPPHLRKESWGSGKQSQSFINPENKRDGNEILSLFNTIAHAFDYHPGLLNNSTEFKSIQSS